MALCRAANGLNELGLTVANRQTTCRYQPTPCYGKGGPFNSRTTFCQ